MHYESFQNFAVSGALPIHAVSAISICVYYAVLISFMNHESSQNFADSGALPIHAVSAISIYFPGTL